jgi:DNA-binding MurR/RpiR family transcriptional regulator
MSTKKKAVQSENRNHNEEYFARIQKKYNTLSASGKRIADFLMLNGHENNLKYNISDFSKELNVSAATIVRFCRTLGFSGFGEFRYYMQRGILSPIGSSTQINSTDTTHAIIQKIAHLLSTTTLFVADTIDKRVLSKAIEAISRSKTIFFCGAGSAAGLAHVAASIFQNIGMKSISISDELMQMRFVHTLEPCDVVVGITNCGHIKSVVDALKIAKDRNIPTICITGTNNSLVTKYSDIVLYSSMDNFQYTIDQSPIIIAQLTIINALQMGCAVRNVDTLKLPMLHIQKINELKRYSLRLKKIKIDRVKF